MNKYDEINTEVPEPEGQKTKYRWKTYFLRQLLVSSAVWAHYFVTGLFFGTPTVLIPQMRREANSTEAVGEEIGSWLCSVFGFSAIPWVFIIPLTITKLGRKIPFIIACVNIFAALIAMYYSYTPMQILMSEILQGMNHATNVTLAVVIISEYTSPKYRGIFLTIKSATFFWGIWISNAIGTFFHWKCIPLFGMVCAGYTMISVFWPESPYWLADKGRFEECRKAHRWLHGSNENSILEVETLIASQTEYLKSCDSRKRNWTFSSILHTITCKQFYKPILLSILMVSQYHLSGKYVCSMYVIDIIKRITKSESTAYTGMLILDGVTVLGMYVGCFLSKILKRRTLFLGSSTVGITFLFIIALYLYLIKLSIIGENNIVSILLLISFSVPISCGPMIMTTSLYGEIIPLRFKTACYLITALMSEIYSTSFLKIAPLIFKTFGTHGTFLFYGIASGFFTVLLYIFLPETKDKTLQEIEYYFKSKEVIPKETEYLKPLQ
ncbi:unnamed protein product [Parnassius mnemosyne]|uniref:Major facilitator superfamily (MFS) profile domain-containing protein n=1 Tax=Parnassius mnemosyne TaxID=213953 RepID=A0AAV1LQA6_9NEOP